MHLAAVQAALEAAHAALLAHPSVVVRVEVHLIAVVLTQEVHTQALHMVAASVEEDKKVQSYK